MFAVCRAAPRPPCSSSTPPLLPPPSSPPTVHVLPGLPVRALQRTRTCARTPQHPLAPPVRAGRPGMGRVPAYLSHSESSSCLRRATLTPRARRAAPWLWSGGSGSSGDDVAAQVSRPDPAGRGQGSLAPQGFAATTGITTAGSIPSPRGVLPQPGPPLPPSVAEAVAAGGWGAGPRPGAPPDARRTYPLRQSPLRSASPHALWAGSRPESQSSVRCGAGCGQECLPEGVSPTWAESVLGWPGSGVLCTLVGPGRSGARQNSTDAGHRTGPC